MELIKEYMTTRNFNYKRYIFNHNDIVKVKNKIYRYVKEDCSMFVCSPLNANNLEYIYFAKDDLRLIPKMLYPKYNIKN